MSKKIRGHRPSLPLDPLNFPAPVFWKGRSVFQVLMQYNTGIRTIFQDAHDVGIQAQVHSVQLIPDQVGFLVVAFVNQDLYAMMEKKQLVSASGQVNQDTCVHDFADGTKCIRCGYEL